MIENISLKGNKVSHKTLNVKKKMTQKNQVLKVKIASFDYFFACFTFTLNFYSQKLKIYFVSDVFLKI